MCNRCGSRARLCPEIDRCRLCSNKQIVDQLVDRPFRAAGVDDVERGFVLCAIAVGANFLRLGMGGNGIGRIDRVVEERVAETSAV